MLDLARKSRTSKKLLRQKVLHTAVDGCALSMVCVSRTDRSG